MLRLIDRIETKKHVIWDWNGTLLNDVPFVVETISSMLETHGLSRVTKEQYRELFCFPVMEYYRRIGFDFDKVSFEILAAQFITKFNEGIKTCDLHLGVGEVLSAVKTRGLTQSVLSAAEQTSLVDQLQHYGLTHHFDHIFGVQDHYAHGKIQRGRDLLDHVGIAAEDTIMIGDTDHDWEVARELGIEVVLLGDGHQSPARLRAVHSGVIDCRY